MVVIFLMFGLAWLLMIYNMVMKLNQKRFLRLRRAFSLFCREDSVVFCVASSTGGEGGDAAGSGLGICSKNDQTTSCMGRLATGLPFFSRIRSVTSCRESVSAAQYFRRLYRAMLSW